MENTESTFITAAGLRSSSFSRYCQNSARLVVLAVILASLISLPAQTPSAPKVQWQRVLGGTKYDAMGLLVEAQDGGALSGAAFPCRTWLNNLLRTG